jgi:hypothetical protein
MLWSAPAAALLSVVASSVVGTDLAAHPEMAAYLFGLTLMGTWGALVPSKVVEGRKLDRSVLRALYLATGVLVGLAGWALGSWLDVGPLHGWNGPAEQALVEWTGREAAAPVGYAGYFGSLFLLGGWPWLAARDRGRRFRIAPAVWAGLLGGLLGLLWPFPQPWGVTTAVLTALVLQSVSPWSEPAASYARYVARTSRRAGRARRVA